MARSAAGIERLHHIEDMVAAQSAAASQGCGQMNDPAVVVTGGRAVNVLEEEVSRLRPDLRTAGIANLFLGSVAETLLDILP